MCKVIPPKHRSRISVSFLALTVSILISARAYAANCEEFKIFLESKGQLNKLRAMKFEYADGSKWKTENLFGLIGYRDFDPGQTIEYKRNLQGIGGEYTYFRVTYKYETWLNGPWSDDKVVTTPKFVCNDLGTKWIESVR